jgi:hypothetical protein
LQNSGQSGCSARHRDWLNLPAKPDFRWLARPRKRHYTFAAAAPIDLDRRGIRHGAIASFNALICRVYLVARNGVAGPGRSG